MRTNAILYMPGLESELLAGMRDQRGLVGLD